MGYRWVVSLTVMLTLSIPLAWAREETPGPQSQDRVDQLMLRYNLHPAFEKFGRGVANTLFGWTEIPLNIHKHYTPTDAGGSFLTGTVYGVFKGLVRTGVGVYEAVTFFLPYPEDYAPILPTLEYFKRSPKREPLPLE